MRFSVPGRGFSVKVPEGWSQRTSGGAVVFTDKLNTIRLEARPASGPLTVSAAKRTVVPRLARQVRGQTPAAVRPAAALRRRRRRRLRFGRHRRVRAREPFGEQQELVGVEAFAARPVQPPQEQVEPMPQRLVVALVLPQGVQQLQDQALQGGHIVGQGRRGRRRWNRSGVRTAHGYKTHLRP